MKAYRRILAIVLTVCLLLPLLPGDIGELFVFKAKAGTKDNPSLIGNSGELINALKNHTSDTYLRQMQDFELICTNATDYNELKEFRGKYDGNGYTITVTNGTASDGRFLTRIRNAGYAGTKNCDPGFYGGLFDSITSTAVVENLQVNITADFSGRAQHRWYTGGSDYFGSIVGRNNGGVIKNCSATGNVVMNQTYAVKNWFNTKDEFSQTDLNNLSQRPCTSAAGGIVGLVTAGGKVFGCQNLANIYMSTGTALTVYVELNKSGGDFKGNVSVSYVMYAGGIAGEMNGNGSVVEACFSQGTQLYLGNGTYSSKAMTSSTLTSGAGGGVVGLVADGTPHVRYNVVRNIGVYAGMASQRGVAGYLIGHVVTPDVTNLNQVSKNFAQDTITTAGTKNGSAMFTGPKSLSTASFNSYAGSNIGYLTDTLSSMSQVDNNEFMVHTNGGETYPVVLKWLTVDAPVWKSSVITAETDPAANNGEIHIVLDLPYAFAPKNDPRTRLTVANVYYQLLIKDKSGKQKDAYTRGKKAPTAGTADNTAELDITGLDLEETDSITLRTWTQTTGGKIKYDTMTRIVELSATGRTPAPRISPDAENGNLIDGITMTVDGGGDIFYTWAFDDRSTLDDPVEGTTATNFKYSSKITWEDIKGDFTGETLWIKAIAKNPTKNISAVTEIKYTVKNKPTSDAPTMAIGGQNFIRTDYYASGTEVTFTHGETSLGGEIWYTVDGSTPDKNKNIGTHYTTPYKLPADGRSSVQITARLFRDNFPDSQIFSEIINIKSRHGTPIFSIANNAKIPIGQTLSFMLNPSDLPQEIRPDFYLKTDGGSSAYSAADIVNSPGEYYGVLTVSHQNRYSFDYDIYAANIPELKYTIDGNSYTYNFGAPEIRYMDENGDEILEERKEHTPITRIELKGAAGDQVSVAAQLTATNAKIFTNGTETTRTFTFQMAVDAPKAAPTTAEDNLTSMNTGQTVSLSCATSGAQIFYSLKGMPLVMSGGGGYIPARFDSATQTYVEDKDDVATGVQQTTFAYDIINGITVSGTPGSYFTVYAGAVKSDMSPSEIGVYTYRISDMNKVADPTATPVTSANSVATIAKGSSVVLVSATSGARIFYSTEGVPDVTYDVVNKKYVHPDSTKDYNKDNALTGIQVPNKPGSVYTIYAVAMKDGMSDSEVVTLTYKIAEMPVAEMPTAMPKTTDGSPMTLQSGSPVTLQTATSGAEIFYSLTGVPVVTWDSVNNKYVPGTGTSLFDKSITISGNAGQILVIRAITVKNEMENSAIATFTYQLPAPVQAVYASPAEDTVVKGTEVVLSTTTHGATIFYETATSLSRLEDPLANGSPTYTKPIKIEASTYISAMAVKDGVESEITEYRFRLAGEVEPPEPSIPSGSVVAKGTKLTLVSPSNGASITYTKDGSDPSDEKNAKRMHGAEIALDAEEGKSVSISAYAHRTGMTPSEVVSVSYTISKSGEVITVNPTVDSIVKPGDRITLSTSVTGSEIYYTTDGSEPTRDSEKGSTVLVDGEHGEAFVIRAIAATGNSATAPYVFSYQVVARTPAPGASIPNGAVILKGATVVLTAPEGTIYYTTDGSEPASSGQIYTEPISLTGSTVLKIIAVADGKAASLMAEYVYTLAGQVAAPTASLPSGTIDVGSKIVLSTETEEATIYYTTNGVDPTADNLRDCFIYEGPVTISRPVSIRMFALKQGMNASVVNSVTYTVAYPALEEDDEQETAAMQWNADRLFLFDQFVDSGEGPLFEDIVLRDSLTLTVVSAAGDALPENVRLVAVRERSPSPEDEDAVIRALEMKLGALYNISLVGQNDEEVQPLTSGGVEIGLPIPEGYEDTVVLICRINENGTVTAFPTRRSAGMLYAVVDHFSKYAVAVPTPPETKKPELKSWYMLMLAAGALAAGAAALTAIIVKKRKKAKTSE